MTDSLVRRRLGIGLVDFLRLVVERCRDFPAGHAHRWSDRPLPKPFDGRDPVEWLDYRHLPAEPALVEFFRRHGSPEAVLVLGAGIPAAAAFDCLSGCIGHDRAQYAALLHAPPGSPERELLSNSVAWSLPALLPAYVPSTESA